MIKKTQKGYILYNKDGTKKLGGPYKSRKQAEEREREVNYFKQKKRKK